LIHISEIADHRIEHPKEVLKEGEVKSLRVIRIDPDQHRIGLSLRKVDSAAFADKDFKLLAAEYSTDEDLEGAEPSEPSEPSDDSPGEEPTSENPEA
jgi:small subunit ribosomal protein S1